MKLLIIQFSPLSRHFSTEWVRLKLLLDAKKMGREDFDWIQLAQAHG
jgi:hypothetical protein